MRRFSVLLVLCIASTAFADDAWIVPDRFAGACGSAALHLGSGPAFGTPGTFNDPAVVAHAAAIFDGKRVDLQPERGAQSVDFKVDSPAQGVVQIAVDLVPDRFDIKEADVSRYLDEIGAPDEIGTQYAAHPGRWRESLTRHAKTFLACGEEDHRYQVSADSPFEFIPQGTDPTALKAGDTLKVALMGNHRLYRTVPIVLVREGTGRVAVVQAAQNGVAEVVITQPGRYMLKATMLRPGGGDVDWIAESATMTFEARP